MGEMALHRKYNMSPRLAGAACALLALLLSGCFIAENDDRNPIIPAASMAFPLPTGMINECSTSGIACNKIAITRQSWGYQARVVERNADVIGGLEEATDFKLRALQGAGIPPRTYLIQRVDADPRRRQLALLVGKDKGAWEILRPSCNVSISADDLIVDLGEGACMIARDGLTDARLFAILNAAIATATAAYPPK